MPDPRPMLSVIVISPDGSQRQETFDKATVGIGRVSEGNDLVLAGNAVSARHAVLAVREGKVVAADLGSTNGTWLQGKRLAEPVVLDASDTLQIGEFALQVQVSPELVRVQGADPDGSAATMAWDIPAPPPSRSADGISWATVRQSVVGDAKPGQAGSDPATWATLQAPAVSEASHGEASIRIVPPPTPSTRAAPICMSCGAQYRADASFCPACGARRALPQGGPTHLGAFDQAPRPTGGQAASPAPTGFEATGAIPVYAPASGTEATGAIPVYAPASGTEATGAIAVYAPVSGTEATGAIAVYAPVSGTEATGAIPVYAPASGTEATGSIPVYPQALGEGATGTMPAFPPAGVVPASAQQPIPERPTGAAPAASLIVDANAPGAFPGIEEALRMAPAGAVIRVRAGAYPGGLVLDKPVSLVAEGGTVVIHSLQGTCLASYAMTGSVRGFAFRRAGGQSPDAAVVVSRGSLRFERCEFVSSQGPAFVIEGPESEPVVLDSVVRGAAADGIVVRAGAHPRIERCEISNTGRAGIWVQDGGVPVVVQCLIHDTQGQGILVHGESAGSYEDCDIAACRLAGIDVLNGARPVVRRCRIRDSREGCGVIVQYGGAGVFEDCVISGNRLSAVEVRESGQPWFRRCAMIDSQLERGLYVYDQGGGVFEDCEMGRNRRHGVGVRSGAQATVRRCRIHGSQEAGGIYVYRQGAGVFEDCEVTDNHQSGIEVVDGGRGVFARCRSHRNGGDGIRLRANEALMASECEIAGNSSRALDMEAGARARFDRCAFVGECVCAVDCTCETNESTFRPA